MYFYLRPPSEWIVPCQWIRGTARCVEGKSGSWWGSDFLQRWCLCRSLSGDSIPERTATWTHPRQGCQTALESLYKYVYTQEYSYLMKISATHANLTKSVLILWLTCRNQREGFEPQACKKSPRQLCTWNLQHPVPAHPLPVPRRCPMSCQSYATGGLVRSFWTLHFSVSFYMCILCF